jgi:hypothetical protein
MTYRDKQREIAIQLANEDFFNDPGNGDFNGRSYPFVLKNAKLGLWSDIHTGALAYFKENKIPWWESTVEGPTGHLLSSQIACINHLYYIRHNKELATLLLKNIDNRIVSAEEFTYPDTDSGYVAFEIVGKENYLHERQHSRGANATSVDAFMVGKKKDGGNILVLIEWKYTEYYEPNKSLYIPERYEIYNQLLECFDSPILMRMDAEEPFESLYYEPFYQLMRQTLLGWQMVKAGEYDSDEYIHVHVIPKQNKELRLRNTSPGLQEKGKDLRITWKSVLKEPFRYIIIDHEELMNSIKNNKDSIQLLEYLKKRYWNERGTD